MKKKQTNARKQNLKQTNKHTKQMIFIYENTILHPENNKNTNGTTTNANFHKKRLKNEQQHKHHTLKSRELQSREP